MSNIPNDLCTITLSSDSKKPGDELRIQHGEQTFYYVRASLNEGDKKLLDSRKIESFFEYTKRHITSAITFINENNDSIFKYGVVLPIVTVHVALSLYYQFYPRECIFTHYCTDSYGQYLLNINHRFCVHGPYDVPFKYRMPFAVVGAAIEIACQLFLQLKLIVPPIGLFLLFLPTYLIFIRQKSDSSQ